MNAPQDTHERDIRVSVNGKTYDRRVPVRMHLADFLRQSLGLTGTHLGCEHGVCGACTVLIDGHSSRGCLTLAVQAHDKSIETVEGLADGGKLHAIQQAFWDKHGLQCGYCTPGILMSLLELLREQPSPDETTVREVLSGHLCRCTGYNNIVAAALSAAEALRNQAKVIK